MGGVSSGGVSSGGAHRGGAMNGGNSNGGKGGSSNGGKGGSSTAARAPAEPIAVARRAAGPRPAELHGGPRRHLDLVQPHGLAEPGSASFTWYHFSQGTYKDPQSGKYQTACGYLGTANGTTDTVENIAGPNYYVAIPGKNSTNFENNKYCGGLRAAHERGKLGDRHGDRRVPQDSNPACVNGHPT
jgi:hypothetical protein